MKHIDTLFAPDLDPGKDCLGRDDRTIVLVTISRYRDDEAISRIKSALPGSEIINLSQLYVDRDLGEPIPIAKLPLSPLTHRQQEISDYLLHGLSNKEIGRKLGLSHFTVRNHVSNILRILDFSCRREMRRSLTVDRTPQPYPISLVA
jgi:DNA-binding NarL/FixJ family response regulator